MLLIFRILEIVCNHYHSHSGMICVLNALMLWVFADLGAYCPASKIIYFSAFYQDMGRCVYQRLNVLLSCVLPRSWAFLSSNVCVGQ